MYEEPTEVPKTGMEKTSSVLASIGKFIFSFIETIVIALVISVVLYLFVMTPHEVVGRSMDPTYKDGEYLMANKILYDVLSPKRGDVIIFKYSETQDFIKRIIGLPGETVGLQDGRIYINGKILDESGYLNNAIYTNGSDYLHEGETIALEDDEYFVCGDNRPHSSDSRTFGPITKDQIKAKAWLVYFPFSNLRFATHEDYQD
ncbi:signal peptidase I [Candidatus Microgenomates bacterium]|nr:signal peptidase I [Candidatus Microgenomates bacterium]